VSPIHDLTSKSIQTKQDAERRKYEESEATLKRAKKEVEKLVSDFLTKADRLTTVEQLEALPIPYEEHRGWKLSETKHAGDPAKLYLDSDGTLTCTVHDSGTYYVSPSLQDYLQAKKSLAKLIEAIPA